MTIKTLFLSLSLLAASAAPALARGAGPSRPVHLESSHDRLGAAERLRLDRHLTALSAAERRRLEVHILRTGLHGRAADLARARLLAKQRVREVQRNRELAIKQRERELRDHPAPKRPGGELVERDVRGMPAAAHERGRLARGSWR